MDLSEHLGHLFSVNGLVSLLTLVILEIVLGIDNVIFISIVAGKIQDEKDRKKARSIGLFLALALRIILLFGISWIISLNKPLFTLDFMEEAFWKMGMEHAHEAAGITGKDLILLMGGLFLIAKTTSEIHEKVEVEQEESEGQKKKKAVNTLVSIVVQIALINLVFSFDSILTAIGIVNEVAIMMAAVIISMIVMMLFSGAVSNFVDKHPTIKMLALAFLLMIGFLLILEAFDVHVPKPYIYFSMTFAFMVELLNMRIRKKETKKESK
jgi:predicted tellurium resistance membrane protein TerC